MGGGERMERYRGKLSGNGRKREKGRRVFMKVSYVYGTANA